MIERGWDMFDLEITDRRFQVYLIVAVALSLNTWDIAFNLGVYGTIFFEKLFAIWVVSTTTLLAYWLLDDSKPTIRWYVQVALLSPSITLLLTAMEATVPMTDIAELVIIVIYLFGFVVTLPIILYVVLIVTIPDVANLRSRKMISGLVGIVFMIAIIGFAIGSNHQIFLTCGDFEVSGNDVPSNCRIDPSEIEELIYP